ncbi:MAG TPA: tetratricopeptide repeat protein [Luteitalea sp.]|nr:tetratricopeptide repeat protein [Luteitalea sp.]
MRTLRHLLVVVTCLGAWSAAPSAIFVRTVTEQVPVARLIANLTRQVEKNPSDGDAHWALARAHAMAASNPARAIAVTKEGKVWYGPGAPFAPFDPMPAATGTLGTPGQQHLTLAIAHHRRALRLLPSNPAIRLGLAWCLQQAGQVGEAIAEYRSTIEAAWKDEGQRTSLGLGGRTIVSEAASYLKPLLDPTINQAEIRTLDQRVEKLASLPVPITPIVVDLEGTTSGQPLVDTEAKVRFDLEGRGLARDWEWITPRSAWLVWDPKETGRITSGRQLFGSVSFLIAWRNGYEALASLDDDGDGWLRADELRGLALWHDRDADGVSSVDEVRPVSWYRITGIAARGTHATSEGVAAWARDGVRYADGSTAPTWDVVLRPAVPRLTRHTDDVAHPVVQMTQERGSAVLAWRRRGE